MPRPASIPQVLLITHEFYPQKGGIAVYAQEMAKALHRMGYAVRVWAPQNPRLEEEQPFPFPVNPLPLRGSQNWSCRLRLAHVVQHAPIDWENTILYLPEPGPLRTWMYSQILWPRHPLGLVVTLHGSELHRLTARFHRRSLAKFLLQQADVVGAVSQYTAQVLLRNYGELESKTQICPGALRTDLIYPDAELPLHPLRTRSLADPLNILTVARIHPRKGQHAVLEALGLLPAEARATFRYTLAGPCKPKQQPYLEHLQQLAHKLEIPFQYLGAVEDAALPSLYQQADIFAMTSEPDGHSIEGFGLSYLEASMHQLPIVAHDTGGVADAVRHGVTGLKVTPGDRQGLAQALLLLRYDAPLRFELGSNGPAWAQKFSWESNVAKLFGKWG